MLASEALVDDHSIAVLNGRWVLWYKKEKKRAVSGKRDLILHKWRR